MAISEVSYEAEVADWREQLESTLRADWVSLAGLYELHDGVHTLGTSADNDIHLTGVRGAPHIGQVEVRDGQVTLIVSADGVRVNGELVDGRVSLRSDAQGAPDYVSVDDLTFFIIKRNARHFIRLRDKHNATIAEYSGQQWYPIDETYRVTASFVPYDPPKPFSIKNILGDASDHVSPGYLVFDLDGREHRLDVAKADGIGLYVAFRDQTTGDTTYRTGRSVKLGAVSDGQVTLDFNRATNPACAVTVYATCPLPPQQNQLAVRIEAGEQRPQHEKAQFWH